MKFKTALFAGLLVLAAVMMVQEKAEARCHKSLSFSVGGPYAPVAVPGPCYYPQPVYVAPYPYPCYDRYVVYPAQPVYVYPPAPAYGSVSFGLSWR